jgi:hypothetical protein
VQDIPKKMKRISVYADGLAIIAVPLPARMRSGK